MFHGRFETRDQDWGPQARPLLGSRLAEKGEKTTAGMLRTTDGAKRAPLKLSYWMADVEDPAAAHRLPPVAGRISLHSHRGQRLGRRAAAPAPLVRCQRLLLLLLLQALHELRHARLGG